MTLTKVFKVPASAPCRSHRKGSLRNLLRPGWKTPCDWCGGVRSRNQCRCSRPGLDQSSMVSSQSRTCRPPIHPSRIDRFKLLFGPKNTAKLCLHSPLPPNKTKEDVLSDYLRYLYDCTGDFIQDAHPDGVFLWKSLREDAQYILSHPTTWGGKQHEMLRECMVQSGLLPDANSSRLAFVSEGEANLHYIMRHRHELGLNSGVGSRYRTPSAR